MGKRKSRGTPNSRAKRAAIAIAPGVDLASQLPLPPATSSSSSSTSPDVPSSGSDAVFRLRRQVEDLETRNASLQEELDKVEEGQPTIRQDNAAFDIICEREQSIDNLQRRNNELQQRVDEIDAGHPNIRQEDALLDLIIDLERYATYMQRSNVALQEELDAVTEGQPTIAQDNAAYDMICELESKNAKLQAELDELRGQHPQSQVKKEPTEPASSTSSSNSHESQQPRLPLHDSPLPAGASSALTAIFLVMFKHEGDHERNLDAFEVKGAFTNLANANEEASRQCKLCFDNWRDLDVSDLGVSVQMREHAAPGADCAQKWLLPSGELIVAAEEADSGRGFVWVQREEVQAETTSKARQGSA